MKTETQIQRKNWLVIVRWEGGRKEEKDMFKQIKGKHWRWDFSR